MAFLIQDIYGVAEPKKRKKSQAVVNNPSETTLPNAVQPTGTSVITDAPEVSVDVAASPVIGGGLARSGNTENSNSSSSTNLANTRDCVICLADEKNTVVLPCRHMCLCQDCAEVLRNQSSKCPICRQRKYTRVHHSAFEWVFFI